MFHLPYLDFQLSFFFSKNFKNGKDCPCLFVIMCCSVESNFDRVGIRKNWGKLLRKLFWRCHPSQRLGTF